MITADATPLFVIPNSEDFCPQDSDGNCIEDVAALVEYIVDKLKKSSTGILAASELGGDIHRRSAWSSVIDNAGGLKLFCLDHADKIQWISSGSGQVQLVKTAVGRRASAMSGSAGVGIQFIQLGGLRVHSVVKDGPAANSTKPPLPGDMLVKVHNSLARARALSLSTHTHTHTHTHAHTHTHTHTHTNTHTRLTATMCGGSARRSCRSGSRARRAAS
jgi:hypothetical protein